MPSSARNFLFLCWMPLLVFVQKTGVAQKPATNQVGDIAALHEAFAHPPDSSRIMMRWWWFGPSATKPELQRELEQMKAAGIGGVEIATPYPLALDDPENGFHNYSFVSDEHLDNLHFAAEEARKLGMRVDITLGSGWPFGGPHIPVTQAAGELRVESVPVAAEVTSIPVPSLESGEQLVAVFLAPVKKNSGDYASARELATPSGVSVDFEAASTMRTALFFISSRTGMMVKRAAQGASGFVLDHYDAAAIGNHLTAVGDRLLSAFGDHPPYAIFSDSLEDYGSDWTPKLLAEFQRRRGYDLTPLLPALIGDIGPGTAAVRHDWGLTLTELANERYLQPIHEWARKHSTLFRSQTYGYPPVTLSSNRYEDLPEGEGKATINMWRQFSDTRWAASAGHLFGSNVISSETWTWLHSPSFRATPLDMKAEADLHFLQGINQLVGHGWPYSPPEAGEPGWRLYAAGAFDAHNPWFGVMPDLTAYLQRVSFALRQGKPANDVALFLPNDDVWASFKARIQQNKPALSQGGFDETGSNVTIDESMPQFLGNDVIPQILDSGFNFDFIDADAIDSVGIPYKVLILPGISRIPPSTYQRILEFARRGGTVIATRQLPDTAPGYLDAETIASQVKQASQTLFHTDVPTAHFVPDEHALGEVLKSCAHPDLVAGPGTSEIGFIHRRLESGNLYFVVNTANRTRRFRASFRDTGKFGEIWDPFTGTSAGLADPKDVQLELAPYESRLLYFSDLALTPTSKGTSGRANKIDISKGWSVNVGGRTARMPNLVSWTEEPGLRYYSGTAEYEKTLDSPRDSLQKGVSTFLDFGDGEPVALPNPLPEGNMRAYLESPVREAAIVYVNDRLAGYVWHPPYRVEITKLLQPGANRIRIVVGNTAINELAGTALPDYRLLYSRYGVEFIPQGMNDLKPLPSGVLGRISLVEVGP